MDAEISFLDKLAGPDTLKKLILGKYLAARFDEEKKQIEGLWIEWKGFSVLAQDTLRHRLKVGEPEVLLPMFPREHGEINKN